MLFKQIRIGKNGVPFVLYKIRSINKNSTTPNALGRVLRKSKIDEIPQLYNIIKGDMAFVGPRPDIPGYADQLTGDDRLILSIKPGITGLASLKYRNEEKILSFQKDPQLHNDHVIWPDKVRINKWYVLNKNLSIDLTILFYTFFPIAFDVDEFIARKSS
jgi:lipopolysaccharide/colanic/teichoic acid biosynthesis glycosyltransferase